MEKGRSKLMKMTYRSWIVMLLAALVVGAQGLHAEAGESLLSQILGLTSGPFGICIQVTIILVNIVLIGWTIECFINIRRDKLVPPEVIAALQGYIDEGDLEGALQYCEASPNILTRSIAAPLSRMHSGFDAMKGAAEQQLSIESGKLNTHISPVSLCTAIGPMLGLFGTVAGMVAAFNTMAVVGAQLTAADVAGSIGLALMSTVMGLIIAMPGIVIFWMLSNRVGSIMDDIGLVVDEMLDTLRGYVNQQQG